MSRDAWNALFDLACFAFGAWGFHTLMRQRAERRLKLFRERLDRCVYGSRVLYEIAYKEWLDRGGEHDGADPVPIYAPDLEDGP